ncbi:hypothetical protein ACFLWZ_02145 [Chloroflexota bacterium]
MKALATIMIWILWISGIVMGFSTLAIGIMAGVLYNPNAVTPMTYPAIWAVSGFFALVALIGMKIRKDL